MLLWFLALIYIVSTVITLGCLSKSMGNFMSYMGLGRIGRIRYIVHSNLLFIICFLLFLLLSGFGFNTFIFIPFFIFIIGEIFLSAQRYRDVGVSGLWSLLLLPGAFLVSILLMITPGDNVENKFGVTPDKPSRTLCAMAIITTIILYLSISGGVKS